MRCVARRPSPGIAGCRGLLIILALMSGAMQASANGEIGDHVLDLQAHLDEYAAEVDWLIEQVDGIVERYGEAGAQSAAPEALVEHWEAVKFHAAIETNYVPIYASIWQGLFGVRLAIEDQKPMAEVRAQQAALEQALWQALGAVKLAAKLQQSGGLAQSSRLNGEGSGDASPRDTLRAIERELDRVVAKYAERLPDEALGIVHDTYISRFEGVEGTLIEQDADLVEDLELDFNVTLPKAIEGGSSVDEVRAVVQLMQGKLSRAGELLEAASSSRSSVF